MGRSFFSKCETDFEDVRKRCNNCLTTLLVKQGVQFRAVLTFLESMESKHENCSYSRSKQKTTVILDQTYRTESDGES